MNQEIKTILASHYGLERCSIEQTKGGWAASAYVIETDHEKYFAKAYDSQRLSTAANTQHAESIGAVLLALGSQCGLKQNLPTPIKNNQNRFLTTTNLFSISLFEYIQGTTIAERKMSEDEKIALGNIVRRLHQAVDQIQVPSHFPKEDFSIPNVLKMERFLADDLFAGLLRQYLPKLQETIHDLKASARRYQQQKIPFVLCHTDIHKWNLMRTANGLVLLDFDTLMLAPKEQDLRLLDADFQAQVRAHYDPSQIDEQLIRFYAKLRVIDDIVEEIELNFQVDHSEIIKQLEKLEQDPH